MNYRIIITGIGYSSPIKNASPKEGVFHICLTIKIYPRKAIRMPAATAEPITPDTLLDIQ